MKISLNVLFLFLAGLLLLIIGSLILLMPQTFYASDGVLLGNNPSLLSEIRASGGMLAGGALVIFAGVVRPTVRSLAMTLSILIYGSFGLSRLLHHGWSALSQFVSGNRGRANHSGHRNHYSLSSAQDQFNSELKTRPASTTHRRHNNDCSRLSNFSHLLRSD